MTATGSRRSALLGAAIAALTLGIVGWIHGTLDATFLLSLIHI